MINEAPLLIVEEKQPITITTSEVILIEAFSIFIIVSLTMFATIWFDVVEKGYSQFNSGLLGTIFFNAFTRTVMFLLGYSFARKLYSIARHSIHKGLFFVDDINKRQLFVIHIFAVAILIVTFGSIRPVIQRPMFSDDFTLISDVTVGFTNYDFLHTIYIIIPISIVAICLMYLFNSGLSKKALLNISVIFIVFSSLCSLYNYKDSFDEKILEARGHLNMTQEGMENFTNSRDEDEYQRKVGEKILKISEEALALAKNEEQKALALRWVASGLELQGLSEKAFESINESIRLDPQDYSYGELVYIAISLKKFNLAIEAGRTCINMNPSAFYCYAPLAKAEWFMGDYEKSKETIKMAISYSPNSKLLNDLLIYYEENIPINLANYTFEQREMRKGNEPLNICLADAWEAHFEIARDYCEMEGKDRDCREITAVHGYELDSKYWDLRQECFDKFGMKK